MSREYLGSCFCPRGTCPEQRRPFARSLLPFARNLLRGVTALALVSASAHASDLPSGQSATLHEVLIDTVNDAPWLRFRFVTPAIARDGGTVSYAEAEPDMAHLCQTLALPYLDEHNLTGEVIVISFADRITEFGVQNPDATQFFEAYRIENGTCIWEGL